MRSKTLLGLLWVTLGFSVVACGASQSQVEDPYLPPEQEGHVAAPAEAPECVGADDKPVECTKDSECCQGFVCGKDPEQNQRERFCIYAGE